MLVTERTRSLHREPRKCSFRLRQNGAYLLLWCSAAALPPHQSSRTRSVRAGLRPVLTLRGLEAIALIGRRSDNAIHSDPDRPRCAYRLRYAFEQRAGERKTGWNPDPDFGDNTAPAAPIATALAGTPASLPTQPPATPESASTPPPPTTASVPTQPPPAPAQPEPPTASQMPPIALQQIVAGFDRPLHITHAGDGSGRLFVVEKVGRIRIVRDGSRCLNLFLDITDRVGSRANEQGLLSVAFHPRYRENGWLFVNYTDNDAIRWSRGSAPPATVPTLPVRRWC